MKIIIKFKSERNDKSTGSELELVVVGELELDHLELDPLHGRRRPNNDIVMRINLLLENINTIITEKSGRQGRKGGKVPASIQYRVCGGRGGC